MSKYNKGYVYILQSSELKLLSQYYKQDFFQTGYVINRSILKQQPVLYTIKYKGDPELIKQEIYNLLVSNPHFKNIRYNYFKGDIKYAKRLVKSLIKYNKSKN